jgi:transcriptional antiterminator NusG
MQNGKIFWYVLFARTGAEKRIVERLKNYLDGEHYRPFVLKKTCVFRRQGKKSVFQKVVFPGYVFIESHNPPEEFIVRAVPIVYNLWDAYRFLRYGDGNMAMRDEERIALSRLFGDDRCIDISIGFQEGDAVRIVSGALMVLEQESRILRINKSRREAVISVEMFGQMITASVGLEVIEKIGE